MPCACTALAYIQALFNVRYEQSRIQAGAGRVVHEGQQILFRWTSWLPIVRGGQVGRARAPRRIVPRRLCHGQRARVFLVHQRVVEL